MKLKTHIYFAFALTSLYLYLTGRIISIQAYIVLFILVSIMQILIDGLGHDVRGGVIVRSKLTHSICGMSAFSLIYSLLMMIGLGLVHTTLNFPDILSLSLISGYSHLLLDFPTEKGIYVMGRRREKRWLPCNTRLNNIISGLSIMLIILYIFNTFLH